MSIDDKFLRDPRVRVLAKLCGWSVRETRGALLDVWAVTYDQVTPMLSEAVIDMAAELDGFTAKLIEAELGARDRSGKVRIVGAKKRIEYLDHKKRAGRQGGLKSAEARDKEVKQKASNVGSTPQAAGNPIPTVPDTASSPDPASATPAVPQSESASARAIQPSATPVPDGATADARWYRLRERLWQHGKRRYGELVGDGVDNAAIANAWTGLCSTECALRVRELRDRKIPVEEAEVMLLGAVETAAANARERRNLAYFVPSRFFERSSFAISLETSPQQATRKRASAQRTDPMTIALDELSRLEREEAERTA